MTPRDLEREIQRFNDACTRLLALTRLIGHRGLTDVQGTYAGDTPPRKTYGKSGLTPEVAGQTEAEIDARIAAEERNAERWCQDCGLRTVGHAADSFLCAYCGCTTEERDAADAKAVNPND